MVDMFVLLIPPAGGDELQVCEKQLQAGPPVNPDLTVWYKILQDTRGICWINKCRLLKEKKTQIFHANMFVIQLNYWLFWPVEVDFSVLSCTHANSNTAALATAPVNPHIYLSRASRGASSRGPTWWWWRSPTGIWWCRPGGSRLNTPARSSCSGDRPSPGTPRCVSLRVSGCSRVPG